MMLIRHGTRIIEYGPLPESAQEGAESRLAARLGVRLLTLADGRRVDDPATWIAVAGELGCTCAAYHEPRAPLGEYCPSYSGRGCITFNRAVTAYRQARTIIHEMAHHLLIVFGIVPWWEYPVTIRYEQGGLGGGWHMRHRLARRVERFVFGF